MRLVILGGSGAGKSTQAQRLCTHFDISLISTSEILRQAIANQTDLGHQAQPYLGKGELVPDETMIQFIETYLKQTDFTNWVLEGYPRTAFQAEELDFLLEKLEQKLDWAIYLQVSEAVMVSRSVGRSLPDDHLEVVQRRVELFYDRTIPILEYYDRSRRLLTINGDQSPIQVQQTIVDLLPVA